MLREAYSQIPQFQGVSNDLAFDDENGNYNVIETGWEGYRRIVGVFMQCSIRNGKIYVEHDGASLGLVDMLLERRVPASDIVIGWHHPSERSLTEFALA